MAAGAGQPTLANISAYSVVSRQLLIEQYLRSSFLLQQMPFENVVTPLVGQGILSYSYARTKTMRSVAFRDWYVDYAPEKAELETVTAFLKPFGGAHEIDRVFADADAVQNNPDGFASYVDFQTAELARAGAQKFHDAVINGDTAVDPLSFDGLSKILTGTDSEVSGASLNLYDPGGTGNPNFWAAQRALQKYIARVRQIGLEPVIFTNEDGAAMLSSIAAQLNYRNSGTDAYGATVDRFAGAPIIDLGVKPGTAGTSVIPTTSGSATPAENGLTDLYVAGLGINGVHAVTLTGDSGFKQYSNIFDSNPGVTKRFEIEMVTALVSKQTRAAYALRDVRVAPEV